MQTKTSIAFLTVLLALAGCDGSPPPADPDAGPSDTDSGPSPTPDSGPAPAEGCDAARAITLTDGEQTITGNTTGMGMGIDLGDECGYDPAPQEILALTVPGTGPKTVLFDLEVGTTAFDTIVQVRPNGCESLTGATCFDDINLIEEVYQSAGHFDAEGGSTVHLIVTGYAQAPDVPAEHGRWTMAIDVRESAPTLALTGGEARRFGAERYELLVDGADSDGDVIGVLATFLDASGAPISYMDYPPTLDWVFDTSLEGETTFEDALITIDFADFVSETAAATQVQIALFDRFGYITDPMTFAIRDITIVGRGETCNADALCRTELECIADTCQVPPAVVTACTAASALTFTEGAASATGSLEPGTGHLSPSCANLTPHAEELYTVEVPAGAFDLIASTDNTATGAADTVVFLQSTCGDSATEAVCDDDVDFEGDNLRSSAVVEDVAAGTYTIAVEIVGTHDAATAYQLDVRLRPVIGEGVTCDPMEIMNRCSTGACPTGDSPVCPAAPAPAP